MDISRPVREDDPQQLLFELPSNWRDEWHNMPEFSVGDARPVRSITLNFMSHEDVADFAQQIGRKISRSCDSLWFPEQRKLRGEYEYDGPQTDSKYPGVCSDDPKCNR